MFDRVYGQARTRRRSSR